MLVKVTQELIAKTTTERDEYLSSRGSYFPYSNRCLIAQAVGEACGEDENVNSGFSWVFKGKKGEGHSQRALLPEVAQRLINAFDNQRDHLLKPVEFEVEWIPY